jgi:hypothetical protein
MPDIEESFTHIVVRDVVSAQGRLQQNDTPTHRRELVKAVFSAIEGLNWRLKASILEHASRHVELNPHEHAAMMEQTYSIDDRGNVSASPRFLPLTSTIRLVVRQIQKYRPGYTVDFGHPGWEGLKISVGVRNRLIHPKKIEDLSVTKDEIDQCMSAFGWMLALNIEALSETNEHLKEMRRLYDQYLSG